MMIPDSSFFFSLFLICTFYFVATACHMETPAIRAMLCSGNPYYNKIKLNKRMSWNVLERERRGRGPGGGGAAEERRESIMATLSKLYWTFQRPSYFGQPQSATGTAEEKKWKTASEWGTCTSSCGCAKNRKTGCERLPGWHRVNWVAWGPSNTVIFEREAVRTLQKKRSWFWRFSYGNVTKRFCFPWGLLTRWHFASFGDCASLKATFRVDAFYELMLYLLWGEVDVKGKKAELTERFVWSCLFLHTYNTPSAFLGCRMRDLLDSEAGGDALSEFYILSKGLPTTVLQTRLQIAFMDVGVLERTEGETETTTRWTTSFTTLDHLNSEVP